MRSLGRSRGFAAAAIVVSALGIGATTATFSLTDHVLLRPLPFPEPDRLVQLWQTQLAKGYGRVELSPANYRDWKRASSSFEAMGAMLTFSTNLVGEGDPERLERRRGDGRARSRCSARRPSSAGSSSPRKTAKGRTGPSS